MFNWNGILMVIFVLLINIFGKIFYSTFFLKKRLYNLVRLNISLKLFFINDILSKKQINNLLLFGPFKDILLKKSRSYKKDLDFLTGTQP